MFKISSDFSLDSSDSLGRFHNFSEVSSNELMFDWRLDFGIIQGLFGINMIITDSSQDDLSQYPFIKFYLNICLTQI